MRWRWKTQATIVLLVSTLWLAATPGRSQTTSELVDDVRAAANEEPVPGAVEQPYFDLDAYLENSTYQPVVTSDWQWQLMPGDLIYKSYLAGIKEPRAGSTLTYIDKDGWLWEGIMGARVGIVRYGDRDPRFPQGFQLDVEGAASVRLDIDEDVDVRATDYRVGIPFTYGIGVHQFKLAPYHMSSHLGDEFVLRHLNYPRMNWSRDALALGYSIYMTETLRLYAEAGWATRSDVNEPWEFQFGADWAPTAPTGFRGAPFFAINTHLRQEVDFSGNFTVVTGWSWMSNENRRLLRIGIQYYNGMSSQYSFYNQFEETIAIGAWYDF